MSANPNWPRWMFASVADHFKQAADAGGLPLLIEGIEDRTSEKIRKIDHAELRINGPILNEVSKGYFKIRLDVNILIQSMMTEQNAYKLMQNCGVMLAACDVIGIFRVGIGPDDDQEQIGCFFLRKELAQPVSVIHFGQLAPDVRIRSAIVSAQFETYLSY